VIGDQPEHGNLFLSHLQKSEGLHEMAISGAMCESDVKAEDVIDLADVVRLVLSILIL
jgi:hypothetical protein